MRISVALLLFCFCFGFALCSVAAQEAAQNGADQQFGIRLDGVDGKTYDTKDMRGHVVVVSFGATWCAPCKKELQLLEELKSEYRDRPVKFLWVSIENQEQASDKHLANFARALKFTSPVLRDPNKLAFGQFSARTRLPLIVFFDAQGKMDVPVHVGMAAPDKYKADLRARIDKLLANAAILTNSNMTARATSNKL
jgi:thiol-disulfide isomerase/thioredoxin